MAKFLSRKHLFLSSPAQSWTPTMPKMKKTKKHSRRTLPNIGRVSSSRVTRILMPVGEGRITLGWEEPTIPSLDVQKIWDVGVFPQSLKREGKMPKAQRGMGTNSNLQRVDPRVGFPGVFWSTQGHTE